MDPLHKSRGAWTGCGTPLCGPPNVAREGPRLDPRKSINSLMHPWGLYDTLTPSRKAGWRIFEFLVSALIDLARLGTRVPAQGLATQKISGVGNSVMCKSLDSFCRNMPNLWKPPPHLKDLLWKKITRSGGPHMCFFFVMWEKFRSVRVDLMIRFTWHDTMYFHHA